MSESFQAAVVIGRFQPFQNGHAVQPSIAKAALRDMKAEMFEDHFHRLDHFLRLGI